MAESWLKRVEREHRLCNISAAQEKVLMRLWWLLQAGDDMPSEARLANLTGTSRSTVQRAKQRGKELGLLCWEREWRTVDGRREEMPCSYRALMPTAECVKRERQIGARPVSRSIQRQLELLAVAPKADPKAMETARLTRIAASAAAGKARMALRMSRFSR